MKQGNGLKFDSSHPMHKDYGKRVFPKMPGIGAEPMAATGQKSVRNWRTSKGGKLVTPGVNTASPCGGYVAQAQVIKPIKSDGKINKRHAAKRMAKVQANGGKIYW